MTKEQNLIQRTPAPVTVDSLSQDLHTLGLQPGDTVLVHASLSKIGWVCGGPQTVILALMKAICAADTLGTLVMPAHSGDWSDPAQWENPPVPEDWVSVIRENMPAYDPAITPTRGMGAIAELFRTYPGTTRSQHPQLSFSANGPLADLLTSNHPLTPALGEHSPIGRLYARNAKILLIGVGYDACTSFHLAETWLPGMLRTRMGTARYDKGQRIWDWFEDYDWDSDDFPAAGTAFESNFPIQKGLVGLAECRLFPIRPAVDAAHHWMRENRKFDLQDGAT